MEIETQEWYIHLIEQCQAIITEAGFHSRWSLIEGYHQLGERILQEHDNFNRAKIYREEIVQRVANSLGKSSRTIYHAMQFARQYPDLNLLPEGKNISWHQIVDKYLPEKKEDKKEQIKDSSVISVICPRCGHQFKIKKEGR